MITEALKRQKSKNNEKSVINRDAVITSEAKPSEKRGLYITKDSLIGLLKSINENEFRLIEGSSPYSVMIAIPKNISI
jgi:hypothetical protein